MVMPLTLWVLVLSAADSATAAASGGGSGDATRTELIVSHWRETDFTALNCLYLQMRFNGYRGAYWDFRLRAAKHPPENTLESLAKLATKLGVPLVPARLNCEELTSLDQPLVVYMEPEGLGSGQFWVFDRAIGEFVQAFQGPTLRFARLPRDRFQRDWTGYALVPARPSRIGGMFLRGTACALIVAAVLLWLRSRAGRSTASFRMAGAVPTILIGISMLRPTPLDGLTVPERTAELKLPSVTHSLLLSDESRLGLLLITGTESVAPIEGATPEDVLKHPAAFRPRDFVMAWQHGNLYLFERDSDGQQFEMAFDGSTVFTRHPGAPQGPPLISRAGIDKAEERQWAPSPRYFGDVGLRLPLGTGQMRRGVICSEVLCLLQTGARLMAVADVALEGRKALMVTLRVQDIDHALGMSLTRSKIEAGTKRTLLTKRDIDDLVHKGESLRRLPEDRDIVFYLDPSTGAALQIEERYGARLLRQTINADFVAADGHGTQLPKRSSTEYYICPDYVPGLVFDRPILRRTVSLTTLSTNSIAANRFVIGTRTAGTVITDYSGGGKGYVYVIPASAAELDAALSSLRPKNPPARRISFWTIVALNALCALAVGVVAIWRRGRGLRAKNERSSHPYITAFPSAILLMSVISTPTSRGSAGDTIPAATSSDELRTRLNDANAHLLRWYIAFESDRSYRGDSIHRIIAASSSGEFLTMSAHDNQEYVWQKDPWQQWLSIKDEVARSENRWNREFQLRPLEKSAALPGTAPHDIAFVVFGWWPFHQRPAPRIHGMPVVFPDIAACDKYQVRRLQEFCGGRLCHVLEYPLHDRLWIDGRGAVMAREILNPKTGIVLTRLEEYLHREVAAGVWAPTRFRNIVFEENGKERTLDGGGNCTVTCLQVNGAVPTAVFDPQLSPGTVEILTDGSVNQRSGGGIDHLDEIANCLERQRDNQHLENSQTWAAKQLADVLICATALIAIFWFAAQWKRRSAGTESNAVLRRASHSKLARPRTAFSLVELILVIAIIAVLLTILLPVMSRVRKSSRSTACLANLQQWGYAFQMYISGNHGHFISELDNATHLRWWESLAPFNHSLRATLICPEAREEFPGSGTPDPASGHWFTAGSAGYAWRCAPFSTIPPLPARAPADDYLGAYAVNVWLYQHAPRTRGPYIEPSAKGASLIPILGDSKAPYSYPTTGDPVPGDLYSSKIWSSLGSYCMDRHGMGVNVVFLDGHAEHELLANLWTLQWSKDSVPRQVTIPSN